MIDAHSSPSESEYSGGVPCACLWTEEFEVGRSLFGGEDYYDDIDNFAMRKFAEAEYV